MTALHDLGIDALAGLIARRELSAIEATRAMLDRIAAHDGALRSFLHVAEEDALAAAGAADRRLAAGLPPGPLHGVPIAVKDIFPVAGWPCTAGMPLRAGRIAAADCSVVRRLKAAGAVILGTLNLTEGAYAEHRMPRGAPANPWSAAHWPGASSSGSGVAVAARLCLAALGSDTGGSIRLPSAVTGVTGLKPTWGRVSRAGVVELAATLDHVGPMAGSAADCARVLAVIAGDDPEDPTTATVPVPDLAPSPGAGLAGLRLGLDRAWNAADVDPAATAAVEAAAAVLAGLGAELREVRFPDPAQIIDDWFVVCAAQTALAHRETFPARRADYGPALAALLDLGNGLSARAYQECLLRRLAFRGRVDRLFLDIDLLATPVLAFPPPTSARMAAVDEATIHGLHRFTCTFTMSGHPTLTLPAGVTAEGLPLAVQLVAPAFGEAALLRAGAAFQSVTDWHRRRPLP